MATKLVIEFERKSLGTPPGDEGYFLRTKVLDSTDPDTLEECLVLSRLADEPLVRVASLAELSSLTVAPTGFKTFRAASLSGSSIGHPDRIRVYNLASPSQYVAPRLWREMGYPTGYVDYEVASVVTSDYEVTVSTSFPAYGGRDPFDALRSIYFQVWREIGGVWTRIWPDPSVGTYLSDGIADRTYAAPPTTNYRVKEHYDLITSLSGANLLYAALLSRAQSLVNSYNEDKWSTGTTEEVFE
jgi:hypothetical protein